NGSRPNRAQLEELRRDLFEGMKMPAGLEELLRRFPKDTTPMEALRTAVSAAGMFDPDGRDNSLEVSRRRARRLMRLTPVLVAAFYRLSQGLEPLLPQEDRGLAANFLYMLTG